MALADSESVMIRPRKPSVRRSWVVMTAGDRPAGRGVSPGTLAVAVMIEGMPAWVPRSVGAVAPNRMTPPAPAVTWGLTPVTSASDTGTITVRAASRWVLQVERSTQAAAVAPGSALRSTAPAPPDGDNGRDDAVQAGPQPTP